MNKTSLVSTLISCLAAITGTAQTFEQAHPYMPIHLDSSAGRIYTQDYVLNRESVTKVFANGPYQTMLSVDSKYVTVNVEKSAATISPMIFESNAGGSYTVMLCKSHRRDYTFELDPQGKNYNSIYLAGDFNNWNPGKNPMTFSDGKWHTHLYIAPGHYKYMLVVKDKWMRDPSNPDSILNISQHTTNSVLTVKDNSDKHPLILDTKSYADSGVSISTHGDMDQFFAFWNNEAVNIGHSGSSKDYFVGIPAAAKTVPRSYVQAYASNGHLAANEIVIPLKYGKVVTNVSDLTRNDAQRIILYTIHPNQLGDGGLKTLVQKVQEGYFTNLGINTIAISNINGRNSDIAPASLTSPDKSFTDEATLKALVAEAHKLNINILLGVNCDKVSADNPLCKLHPEFFATETAANGNKRWSFTKQSTDAAVDSNLAWVNKYGIDGFYAAEANNMPISFWRMLNVKMKTRIMVPQKRTLYLFGEVKGNRLNENDFIGNGLFNGVKDMTLSNDIAATLADTGKSMETISTSAYESDMNFGWHNNMAIGTDDYITSGKEAYALHDVAEAIKFALPGIPTVRCGEESAQNLKSKSGIVQFANLSKNELDAMEKFKKLAKARESSIAALLGETQYSVFDDKVLAITRTYFQHGSVTLVNKSNQPQSVTFNIENYPATEDEVFKPSTVFGTVPTVNVYIEKIQTVTIDLPAYGIEVVQY